MVIIAIVLPIWRGSVKLSYEMDARGWISTACGHGLFLAWKKYCTWTLISLLITMASEKVHGGNMRVDDNSILPMADHCTLCMSGLSAANVVWWNTRHRLGIKCWWHYNQIGLLCQMGSKHVYSSLLLSTHSYKKVHDTCRDAMQDCFSISSKVSIIPRSCFGPWLTHLLRRWKETCSINALFLLTTWLVDMPMDTPAKN